MTGRLEDRRTIITGASRGIGAGIAERSAGEGARLALVARTLDAHPTLAGSLNETAERCRALGADVVTIVADLTDETDRARVVPEAADALGGHIEVLVNNAAGAIYQTLDTYPLKRRRLMTEINIHCPLDLAQAALPGMAAAGEGWIVNLSSGSARPPDGPPYDLGGVRGTYGFYAASKAMLNRLSMAMAAEWHEHGVRVNTVEPKAAVLSEGADELVGAQLSEDQIESMEAMCEAALWLCDCGPDHTGKVEASLDLLTREGVAPMNLQGTALHPNGHRR
ncbi:MAG: SDR family NAD(P)-dependent oxidoreductase [Acidimicrobiales bacterium]